uniref:Uncharacterized protein n=3 Tax=Canis lupus TaxID=9612 RepID=A0A8C0SS01_CANLF
MKPVFSKSDLIRPASRWHKAHQSTHQARVETLFGLSCKPLLCLFVSLDYPFSASRLPSPP